VKLGWGNATLKKHVGCVVQFVKWARKRGYHESNAYRDIDVRIRVQKPETNVVYLNVDEIARLNQLKFKENESRLEKARDVFLFACFTGLRHSDLKNLKRSDIKNGDLVITSQKTEDSIRVPIVSKAKDILDKYKDSNDVNPLPVQSQQRYNDYLKIIGERAKLNDKVTLTHFKGRERVEETFTKWELLSSHVARKTFVTMAVFLKIPMETVRRITGHKSDAIEAYYRILDSEKRIAMQKFDELKIV
jgi:integrase